MKKALAGVLVVLFAVVGCAATAQFLDPKPDPRVSDNALDAAYFAGKDSDPADAARAAAFVARAKQLAAESGRIDDLQRRLDEIQKSAGQSGTPVGQTIATVVGVIGFLLTAGKTAYRTVKGLPTPGDAPAPATTTGPAA